MQHPYLSYPALASSSQAEGPLDPPPEPIRRCKAFRCNVTLSPDEDIYCEDCAAALVEDAGDGPSDSDIAVLLRFHNEGKQ